MYGHGNRRPARWARACVDRAPLVVVAWLIAIALLNVVVPQLGTVVARDSTPIVPADVPSSKTTVAMDKAFGNGRSDSFVFVVVEREGGLTTNDLDYVHELAPTLRADTAHVSFVQDISKDPELLKALRSEDGEAVYLQVGLPGATGAPTALEQVEAVHKIAHRGAPDGLRVEVTGGSATIADMAANVESSIFTITMATVGLIALILVVIYRSFAVTALALTVIGLALAGSRALVSFAGQHGIDVSTFTASFLTAVVLGAATDYVVFLLSRYHESRRAGVPVREAAAIAASRVSGVIIGSAMTVVLATATMLLADVGLYTTTGPAIALSVALTLLMALTLTPALIALAGDRGFLEPRNAVLQRHWESVGTLVTRHPGRVLVAGLIPLAGLAAFYPLLALSYDESQNQPDSTSSSQGYVVLAKHYPINEVLPDYLLIQSKRDMRNAKDLAALEQASSAAARVDGVAMVRGITRPLGSPITEASVAYQSGRIAEGFDSAGHQVGQGRRGTDELDDGANQLKDGAGQVAAGAKDAANGAGQLLEGVRDLRSAANALSKGSKAASAGSSELRAGARQLAAGLDSAHAQTKVAVDALGTAYNALRISPLCGVDPVCRQARDGIKKIYEGERDQLLPGLAAAARAAHDVAAGAGDLQDGLARIDAGLDEAAAGSKRLVEGQTLLHERLDDLSQGADAVAGGASLVKSGTSEVKRSIADLEEGLGEAADYLREVGALAKVPEIGGFYLPPSSLKDERLASAAGIFMSPNGHTARIFVLGETDAFGQAAMERSGEVLDAVRTGLKDTTLTNADVGSAGMSPALADLEKSSQDDFQLVALAALAAVFLVLLLLLRSIVAAGVLLASVALSYASAIGLAVLVWQVLLGTPLDWSVPAITFILLVAVGADYNLLLTKRMREEAPDGNRDGIARAVALTGGVITTAGVIFAVSVFAMMAGGVVILSQIGFTIGMGLLIDTFIVRTLVVPAMATLLGRHLWWPSRPTESLSSAA